MKILVVEDEQRIAHYIKKGLELKSHIVDVAYDGQSGYEIAAEGSYDILILDRMLPQIDGIQVCQQLRSQKIYTPILMLTAKNQLNDRVEGLNAGADDYLGKPFAFTELLARVNALGRRPKKTIDPILAVGDLSLNPISFEVTRSDQKIHLSKKEFSLLEFLMRHREQVFSPEQLTELVWNYDSDVLPNTAQVYMGYLRQKIDRNFKHLPPLITTVRGFGYKLG
jgi:DNA-binding response OmpR family regulator